MTTIPASCYAWQDGPDEEEACQNCDQGECECPDFCGDCAHAPCWCPDPDRGRDE